MRHNRNLRAAMPTTPIQKHPSTVVLEALDNASSPCMAQISSPRISPYVALTRIPARSTSISYFSPNSSQTHMNWSAVTPLTCLTISARVTWRHAPGTSGPSALLDVNIPEGVDHMGQDQDQGDGMQGSPAPMIWCPETRW